MTDQAECKQAFAELARYPGDEPEGARLAKVILKRHGATILEAWSASLPRFTGERTAAAAWQYHVELDRAWKRWIRSVQRSLGLDVHASPFADKIILTVGARERDHYFQISTTEVAVRSQISASAFFDRAWAKLALPVDDIFEANRILAAPHDIAAAATEMLWFARPRPPRSAPRKELISWLVLRQLLREATRAELAELEGFAVDAVADLTPDVVMPPIGDDEPAWSRWLLDVDFAVAAFNRKLQHARVFVRIDREHRMVRIKPLVELRGLDEDDVGVVESDGVARAVENLVDRIGAPYDRLLRAVKVLEQRLHGGFAEKLDYIRYADWDALEQSPANA